MQTQTHEISFMYTQTAGLGITQNKDRSFNMSSVTLLSALCLETKPICCKIILTQNFLYKTLARRQQYRQLTYQPCNMDLQLRHSCRVEADSLLAVLYFLSSSLTGVGVSLSESCSRDLQRAKCQGSGPMGALAAHCAEDKLSRSIIDEFCTTAWHLHNCCIQLQKDWMHVRNESF